MAVVYLEPEDEITGAVARLRAMPGGDVVMVVPAGSRVSTSRINFRLLAKEARERGLRLAVVSDEPGVRSLSTAAGVPAHELGRRRRIGLCARPGAAAAAGCISRRCGGRARGAAAGRAQTGCRGRRHQDAGPAGGRRRAGCAAGVRPPRAGGRLTVEPPLYDVGDVARRRRPRAAVIAPAAALVLLLVLVGLSLYAAYLFVPTATVTLQPKLIDVGPLSVTVTADPQVAVIDAAAGLIPASEIQLPLAVTSTFPATGTAVTTTAASGAVRFTSTNTVFEVPVQAGTVVSTANGIDFETTRRSPFPSRLQHAQAGRDGRGRRAATRVSGQRACQSHQEFPRHCRHARHGTQPAADHRRRPYRGRRCQPGRLRRCAAQLTAVYPAAGVALADPNTTPHGLTLYPQLRFWAGGSRPGAIGARRHQGRVVHVDRFLHGDRSGCQRGTGRRGRADAALWPGAVGHDAATGDDQDHSRTGRGERQHRCYNASAAGKSWRSPGTEQLLAQITGKSVTDARTIMERYGTPDITIWPDFIDRLPDQNRIRLTIVPPQETP